MISGLFIAIGFLGKLGGSCVDRRQLGRRNNLLGLEIDRVQLAQSDSLKGDSLIW